MINKTFNLSKNYALITGSAGLLGFQHAAALLECECNVILTDVSIESLEKTSLHLKKDFVKSKVFTYEMDVTKNESIKKVSEKLISENINVDILINNAALNPKVESDLNNNNPTKFENLSKKQWDKELEVGLTGAFLCSQVFGQEMAKRKKGVILNVASDLSVLAPDQRIYKKSNMSSGEQFYKPATYSAIKTGLIGLTKYIATYWAEDGIRCNAISPGGVFNNQDKEFISNIKKLIPIGRMARKDEYRSAVQFLCSEASSYMTGFNMVIDGGRHIW